MVMTYSHAKVQGQRSITLKIVETNGRTDGGDRITSLANAVGKYRYMQELVGLQEAARKHG